jgi:fructose-specific phosphotransferase system IIC component
MFVFLKGLAYLLGTLALFSLFTFKCPKGDKAMSGLANAAVATFLVEALFKYICGDMLGISFLADVGAMSGSMGGSAAVALVGIGMGMNPLFALAAAVAITGYGILPGFLCGYLLFFLMRLVEKHLPAGISDIVGSLLAAALSLFFCRIIDPGVSFVLGEIGSAITAATNQSPVVMGLLLGGMMKVICTSPLSSMALTAMLSLTGLPMGIAAIACFGGTFTNGVIFWRLKLGKASNVVAVMLEPLTQAHIVTKNPIPIYASNVVGGALSGMIAALLKIVNNAPGTASPIPGLLAPFAFNDPIKVILAMALAAVGGTLAGFVGSAVFRKLGFGNEVVPD